MPSPVTMPALVFCRYTRPAPPVAITTEAPARRGTQTVRFLEDLLFTHRGLSAPAIWGDKLAVVDAEGYLHLLSQVDGRFVGRQRIDSDGLRARPLVVGNMLYVYGNGGKLEALTIK